jgi:hypothetical protein
MQAAYILGMIQSDPNRDFPTELSNFIRGRQEWENKNSIPDEQMLKHRIEMINHYKNLSPRIQPVAPQPFIQPAASQPPIQPVAT